MPNQAPSDRLPASATLAQVLRRRAEQQPAQIGFRFLQADQEVAQLTYGELDRRAGALAGLLRQRLAPGARVLICCPAGLEYVVGLLGCFYAGAVAVPAAPLEGARQQRTLPRLRATAQSARPALGLSSRAMVPRLEAAPGLEDLAWLALDEPPAPADPAPPAADAAALAMLMYTSGSTGAPKGVMVSHANILHNAAAFPGYQARPPTAIVSWLPLYHDLGLFLGVVHPIVQGVPAILMDSADFIERPLRWLGAISRHRASTSGGPNFAYDLCARKVAPQERAALDLSCWNLALNGAEPIRPEALEHFAGTFAGAGFRAAAFYPSYGMSDATATVSGPRDFAPPLLFQADRAALERGRVEAAAGRPARTLVGCGPGLADQTTLVVDPATRRPCPPEQVGEIWLSGPSVGLGYWDLPGETAEVFGARLEDGTGPFFRTGDLGFLHAGQVFLTGRLKDLLIFRGQNYYPEDIEASVEQLHPRLRPGCGAAVALDDGGEERLALVLEVLDGPEDDYPELAGRLRQSVAEIYGLQLAQIVLIPRGHLPKTSSGKIARRATREALAQGRLAARYRWQAPRPAQPAPDRPAEAPGAQAVGAWLRGQLAARLGVGPADIQPEAPFSRYGLDSVRALELVGDLSRWLARPLSPTVLWDYPTLAALSRQLGQDEGRRRPLGELLIAARVIAPAQLEAALAEQQRLPLHERLGELLVRRRLADPAQVRAALLRQAGLADSEAGGPAPQAQEPIAIIGMACRFPGAGSLEDYWALLRGGADAIREVPPERWDLRALYDPDRGAPGKMYSRWGGFLEHLDELDAAFMGMSPREVVHLDPQQRLLMEVAWEALEHAGQVPAQLSGSRTGVFVATIADDYSRMVFRDLSVVDAYSGTGGAHSILANRLSYMFNLRGPSVALDTACSGSLVAIHLACQSLRSGETSLALAGGVNVNLLPDGNVFFSKAGALSPDGRCKTFDAGANGIVRSEGVGLVVLKPLSAAQRDGDRVLALICGSAVNQDGHTNGIMAPSRQAQEAVLREAYASAGVRPGQVQYIEAHGTGTALGDVIEAQALGAVLAESRGPEQPCLVGSVKTNIGHTEAAAGIASVIKVALALHRGQIPPSLHFQTPNPMIPFAELRLEVQRELSGWPAPDRPRIAGVSGFGFGGTNCHVVLAAAPEAPAPAAPAPRRAQALALSAHTPEALRELARRYQRYLAETDAPVGDICATAALRRTHHAHRLAVCGASHSELAEALAASLESEPPAGPASDGAAAGRPPRLVFVFSGQGSHWAGMGRTLLADEPVFAGVIRSCDALLRAQAGWSLVELLDDPSGEQLSQTDRTQPAIFAVQVGLAALWRSWGIAPDAVVGHSLGELAAAHVAGALSLEDALTAVVQRSRLMRRAAGRGKTAAVELAPEQARLLLAGREERLAVAGCNSPTSCILSGDPEELELVLGSLERQQIFARLLRGVDIAFHSPQMEPLKGELAAALAALAPRPAELPLVSTVTGTWIDGAALDASYWARNLREPFLFAQATETLLRDGYDLFLEISPHPVLVESLLRSSRQLGRPLGAVHSLRRGADERAALLAGLAALYSRGCEVRWAGCLPADARCASLPAYPWQRQRYWIDQLDPADAAEPARALPAQPGAHPLLGYHLHAALSGQHIWQAPLSTALRPELRDHQVQSTVILPGAVYAELALAVGQALLERTPHQIENLVFKQAMFVPERPARTVQVTAIDAAARIDLQIASASGADGLAPAWITHATAQLRPLSGRADQSLPLEQIRARCPEGVSSAEHYRRMSQRGLDYGPHFRAIREIWRGSGEALGLLALPEQVRAEPGYILHPILLDAAFQIVAHTLPAAPDDAEETTFLPMRVDRLRLLAPAEGPLWCRAVLREQRGADARLADLHLYTEDGRLAALVEGMQLLRLQPGAGRDASQRVEQLIYTLAWEPQAEPPAPARPGGRWLILADRGGAGAQAAALLESGGCAATLLPESGGPAAYAQLDLGRFDHVLHLWALDAPSNEALGGAGLTDAAQRLCSGLIELVQALSAAHAAPRLWLVTGGAQMVPGQPEPPQLSQAPVWGLGRVLLLEHPELRGVLLDLPAAPPDRLAGALLDELGRDDGENQRAVRDGRRYLARLSATAGQAPRQRAPGLRRDGAYLITGGLGGLGLEVARWMAQQGARRLILLGRSALPPRAEWRRLAPESRLGQVVAAVCELEALGAHVQTAAVDITAPEQLEQFVQTYRAEGRPPICGVVHAAGLLRDQLLVRMDPEALADVLAPKIGGAWLLHTAFSDEPLDFFVLFSSLASVLGSVGQANYAAGNAFMDALAHYRAVHRLPALSINWGAWAEVGMAARSGINAGLAEQGMPPLTPGQGVAALAWLLQNGAGQHTVAAIDWPRWLASGPQAGLPLLADFRRSAAPPAPSAATKLAQQLRAQAPEERRLSLVTYLQTLIARVLRVGRSQLTPDLPLRMFGVDSIMSIELKNDIDANLGVALTIAYILQGPSIGELADELLRRLDAGEAPAPEPGGEEPSLAELQTLAAQGDPDYIARLLSDLEQLALGDLPAG